MKKLQPIRIGEKEIEPNRPVYIIFEVASTHKNNWQIAKAYVHQAREAGADALKFQMFKTDKLLNPITSGFKTTYDFFKSAEIPHEWFPKLKELCDKASIDLLCTPFDSDSARFLDSVGVPAIKIASGELTNYQLLSSVAKFEKPVILSTGMATMREIRTAVKILRENGCRELALLQCVSVYPMSYEDANIRAMQTLQEEFGCTVGYSDNGSKGYLVPLLAVALGASIIEKHVTSQKQRGNLDDVFSLSVGDFTQMVKRIRLLEKEYKQSFSSNKSHLESAVDDLKKEFSRNVEIALGDGVKKPAEFGIPRADGTRMIETDERHWARRGLYPKINIPKGSTITKDLIISLRPDIGLSALSLNQVIGAKAEEDLPVKHPIKLENRKVRRFRKSDIKKTYRNKEDAQFVKILKETALFD